MEQRWKIYLITNRLNDKKYVGQTVRSIQERWYQHINSAANKNDTLKFHVAIRTLGSSNFQVSLLEEVETQELADEREMYWVSFYNSYVDGYNSTPGGSTLPVISNERLVYKINQNRSHVLNRYFSVKQASTLTGISASAISYSCRNFSTAGGFYWCYPEDFDKLLKYEAVTCDGKRYIVKIDINTFKVLGEYLGVDKASEETGLSQTTVSQICNDQKSLPELDYILRWKAVWIKEREQVKRNPLIYKPFYVMMLDKYTLKLVRVFRDSYEACKSFDVGRNTLEKHVDVPGSLWRDYLWCTCKNYNQYVDTFRR